MAEWWMLYGYNSQVVIVIQVCKGHVDSLVYGKERCREHTL